MDFYDPASQHRVERQDQLERRTTSAVVTGQEPSASRELGRRLRFLVGEVDDLWRTSMQGQDFDLVWRSSEASLALHRAVLALEDGAAIG